MTDIKKLNEITAILLAHSGPDDGISCSAEHDEMYLGGPPTSALHKTIIKQLDDLGCFWNEEYDCWQVFT